jgi:hypothetical protein
MNVSRRKFLATFSASAAGVLVSAGAVSTVCAQVAGALRGDALIGRGHRKLTWNSIYPYMETDFVFSGADDRETSEGVRLRLVDMSNTDKAAQLFGREPQSFVLSFDTWADDSRLLSERTYAVEHFALGKFELFISEGSLERNKHVYTAVINRVIG